MIGGIKGKMGFKTQVFIFTSKNIRKIVMICLIVQLSTYPIISSVTSRQLQQEEWCVEIGDSRSFIVTKLYDILLPDPHKLVTLEGNEDHEFIYITTEVNTKISYTITEITESNIVIGKKTINDTITLKEEPISGIIRKTIQNKTYWESIYENESTSEMVGDLEISFHTTVTSKVIRRNASYQFISPVYSLTEIIYVTDIVHWEWMTGWVSYRYYRTKNETNTLYEYEMMNPNYSSDDIPWNMIYGGFILLGITGLIIFVNYQRRKR